jgi:NitT/TauT family transport system ATP-binding protein
LETSRQTQRLSGAIAAQDLTVVFPHDNQNITAIEGLSFQIRAGEFACFLGTTGCGKSTILNVIAGFVRPTTGTVLLDEAPITQPGPERGIVFQQFALFPWRTVEGNIEFGPRMRGLPKRERKVLLDEYISLVGLSGFEKSYPSELSGGMQQRVGIARVLANDPSVLLMDEPFGSLDAQTRLMMQESLLDIWQRTKKTIVFVTHDVDEAIFLADRIYVLTARPARIKKEITVNLPRPRSFDIVTSTEYTNLKKNVLGLIREETLKAITRSNHST